MFFLHTAYLWIILRTQADTRKWESIQIVRRRRNETARDKRARIEEREKENEKRTKREERAQQTKEVSTHNLGVNALEEYRCIQKCIAYTIHKRPDRQIKKEIHKITETLKGEKSRRKEKVLNHSSKFECVPADRRVRSLNICPNASRLIDSINLWAYSWLFPGKC